MNYNKNYKLNNFWHFLATGFGSGLLISKFPGTIATGLAILLWFLIVSLPYFIYFLIIVISIVLGFYCCHKTARDIGVHDHESIVWDEFVGIWISLFEVSINDLFSVILCFFIFRLLDIFKPWPICWLDRVVKGGIGIMLDDIVAGLITVIFVHYLYYLLILINRFEF